MVVQNFELLSWNVRGLNSPAKCSAVHDFMAETNCTIACFQETKLRAMDDGLARFLSGYKLDSYAIKPARGT
jgi:exonuclease III